MLEPAEQQDDVPTPGLEVVGPVSPMDELRALRRDFADHATFDVDIPGYRGKLVARYRSVDFKVTEAIARRADKSRSPRKLIEAAADSLIAMCDEILWFDGEKLEPANVAFETGDTPVRYDQQLAGILDIDTGGSGSARAVLFATFPTDSSVLAHYGEVSEWDKGTGEEVDDDFLGEA